MLQILQNASLKSYNTFRVDACAQLFVMITNEEDLKTLITSDVIKEPLLILGGGSNILFTRNFEGLVIHNAIKGISSKIDGKNVLVTAGAGEAWNDLVNYCVDHHFAGMENLSLIPGTVGASPIQNIGAYGVELMDIFESCRAVEIATGKVRVFGKVDCRFSYRDSIFKNELKNKFILTEVTYRLSKDFKPKLEYGAIRDELTNRGILNPSIKDVSQTVSHIRVSKLPDPATIGNAGSFFKNPMIKTDDFRHIQSTFPDIVHYPVDNKHVKLAAGWMIEHCGWRGRVVGNTGTWKNQALVLVNHGNATGSEIFRLSAQIIKSVEDEFGITLEREVNII